MSTLSHSFTNSHQLSQLRLQGEKYCTISMVYPAFEQLYISCMESMDNSDNNTTIHAFAKNLSVCLKQRFSGVFSCFKNERNNKDFFSDDCYKIASVMDPAFRFYWIDYSEIIVGILIYKYRI